MKEEKGKTDSRPTLTKNISLKDFRDFYWLKDELLVFCRLEQLGVQGGKMELMERIEKYLETGIKDLSTDKRNRYLSKFDWNNERLTLNTIITDNYRNTENVREFFKYHIGDKFKFNVKFMNWMKSSQGATLKDAIDEWYKISHVLKNCKSIKKISPQFEYNTYIRDFMRDNPIASREMAIECWKIKKSMRGSNKYDKRDLKLIG